MTGLSNSDLVSIYLHSSRDGHRQCHRSKSATVWHRLSFTVDHTQRRMGVDLDVETTLSGRKLRSVKVPRLYAGCHHIPPLLCRELKSTCLLHSSPKESTHLPCTGEVLQPHAPQEWKDQGLEISTDSDRSARLFDLSLEMILGVYGTPYEVAQAAADQDEVSSRHALLHSLQRVARRPSSRSCAMRIAMARCHCLGIILEEERHGALLPSPSLSAPLDASSRM